MQKNFIRQSVLPVIAALIWGTAFAAQSVCSDFIQPMTFNAIRSLIASVTLFAVYMACSRFAARTGTKKPILWKKLIPGSLLCGLFLALASNMQQLGIGETSAGKSGFITALYIVIVPMLGLFFRKRCGLNIWIAVAIATAGLFFLCISDDFSIAPGDFYLLLCALLFSVHILVIDHYTQHVDGLLLSLGQFVTATLLSGVGMLIFESPSATAIGQCILPILYVGIFSSGVAYTLQIIAMRGANPTVVSILLSLESVFSVLAGAAFLGERLLDREYFGCILMFAAVILSQLPQKKKRMGKTS